jgi:hypothetical protein
LLEGYLFGIRSRSDACHGGWIILLKAAFAQNPKYSLLQNGFIDQPILYRREFIHWVINEARQMISLGLIVIPKSLFMLFPRAVEKAQPSSDVLEAVYE